MSKSSNPYQPPIQPSQNHPNVKQGDATGGVIPYKNPMALTGYYLGFLSLLPLIGILFTCLLYTSPSPRDLSTSRMPSSA